jgi:hypothetical protein
MNSIKRNSARRSELLALIFAGSALALCSGVGPAASGAPSMQKVNGQGQNAQVDARLTVRTTCRTDTKRHAGAVRTSVDNAEGISFAAGNGPHGRPYAGAGVPAMTKSACLQ